MRAEEGCVVCLSVFEVCHPSYGHGITAHRRARLASVVVSVPGTYRSLTADAGAESEAATASKSRLPTRTNGEAAERALVSDEEYSVSSLEASPPPPRTICGISRDK